MTDMHPKKTYASPKLTCLGTVAQLTLAQIIPPGADNQGLPGAGATS